MKPIPLTATAVATLLLLSPFAHAESILVQPTDAIAAPSSGMVNDTDGGQYWLLQSTISGAGLDNPSAADNGLPVLEPLPMHNDVAWASGVRWAAPDGAEAKLVPGTTVTFPLDQTYALNGLYLWNFSERTSEVDGRTHLNNRGLKETTIEFSTDGGSTWSKPIDVNFKEAPATPSYSPEFKALSPVKANAVRLTINSNFGPGEPPDAHAGFYGFNEIRFTADPKAATGH